MKMVGVLLRQYGNYMKTIWKWRKQYENGWEYFKTIWKQYENNIPRMWKGCRNNMEMKWKWNFLSVTA